MRPFVNPATPPRHANFGAGGWWTNPKGVGLNVSYVAKNSSTSFALLRTSFVGLPEMREPSMGG